MNISETAYLVPTLDPAARVLLEAAELLEREGWIQGDLGNVLFGHCAMGAITSVCQNERDVTNAVKRLGLGGITGVINWNDVRGRTKAEVIATLRRAANV